MSKDLAVKESNLPAHLATAAQSREAAKEFSGGVQSGFPVLGYRGKTWRVKQGGEEQVYADDEGDAIQSMNLVLVRSNENLSKTYYKGKYSEGDNSKPNCWSASGHTPDPNVPNPVASKCQGCPMNVWGSRVSDEGKKQKACADVRRMAVIMEHELEDIAAGDKLAEDADIFLLRVPGGSLNPLKDYVEKRLLPKGGLLPFMIVTRIGFDNEAAYPRFTFKASRFLDEDEFGTVEELRESDIVKRIINEAAELEDEGTTDEDDNAPSSDLDAKGEASESAPSESSEESHMDDDVIAPPPPKRKPKKRAAAVEEESTPDEDDIAPPKKKRARKPATKKVDAAPEPKDDESPVADEDDVDAMLDSILG